MIAWGMVFTLAWCVAMTLALTGLMNIYEYDVNMTFQKLTPKVFHYRLKAMQIVLLCDGKYHCKYNLCGKIYL